MKNIKNNSSQLKIKNQTGAALLIAMVVLASMAVFYLLNTMGPVTNKLEQQDNRVAALAEAKKALIAYAVSHIDTHESEMGLLPCPDMNENGIIFEGGSDNCDVGGKNNSVLGRLPWRSLNIKPLRDDANECLWYAVSGPYRNISLAENKTQMLNDDTNGLFEIYDAQGNIINGSTAEERIVAVILAPGSPLATQNRGGVIDTDQGTRLCRGSYDATQYLEGDGNIDNATLNGVANTIDRFIKSGTNTENAAPAYNDRIAIVTQGDIWEAVRRRRDYDSTMETLTSAIANCFADYGNEGGVGALNNLPWPSAMDLGGADYRLDSSYADTTAPASLLGRLPENVANSEAQLDANATGGGDIGGVSVAGPPDCPACKSKFDKYLEELAEELADFRLDVDKANADYQLCLADPDKTQAECDAALADDLADAQTKYDEEVADIAADELQDYNDCLADKPLCTSNGGGTAGHCTRCQNDYDTALDKAAKDRDKNLGDIPGEYTSCINKPNADIAKCDEERDKDIADANKDYAEDVAEAQALYDLCTTANSCPASGGSKGIENILNNCLATADFDLWRHWKDHFFYVVSGSYAPDSTEVSCTAAGAECVSTGGNPHAAIILFSGERQPGITRNDPLIGDTDTKNAIENYLEGINIGDASPNPADPNGNRVYDANAGNDYLYCINDTDPLTTGNCP